MIRSFHYAAMTTLIHHTAAATSDEVQLLDRWLEVWSTYISGSYLKAYISAVEGSKLIPEERGKLALMLRCYLLQKVVSELGHELSRHNSVDISLRGIEMLLREYRAG